MHAFARSLSKTEIKKEHRHITIKLFAILLNCNTIFDALRLFKTISSIYGDPLQTNVDKAIEPLLPVTDVLDFDLKEFLKDDTDDDLEELSPMDDLLESSDPIIHQSPFSIIVREQILFLEKALSERSKPLIPSTNPYYSKKVNGLFYRWWAYLPMWTCILVDYKEYASDKPVAVDTSVLGRGRLSNAIAESYFEIIKEVVLQKKTRLRPTDFVTKVYQSTAARFKAGQFGVTQSAQPRKSRKPVDVLILETWRKRGRKSHTRGIYFRSIKRSHITIGKTSNRPRSSSSASGVSPLRVSSTDSQSVDSLDISYDAESVSNAKTKRSGTSVDDIQPQSTVPSNLHEDLADDLQLVDRSIGQLEFSKRTASSFSSSSKENKKAEYQVRAPHSATTMHITTRSEHKRQKFKSPSKTSLQSPMKTTSLLGPTLHWPKYGINRCVLDGQIYTVSNTCSLDSVLFVMYYLYSTSSHEYQEIFDRNTLSIYSTLRKTFQLVETASWDIARLYWLITHNRLNKATSTNHSNDFYDIFGTVDENTYRFIRPIQKYSIISECSSPDCPRRQRVQKNIDITLNKEDNIPFPDYLNHFSSDTFGYCGERIGEKQPKHYDGDIIVDTKFPLVDVETGATETKYIM
ncbi:unnamed protein product [Didymodactylos carnosus]|uniref:Uncharacterized protein n=1 Tax=Didymodactylos carnosus TaxID=1234261 RepID=A0A8S2HH60_9BILA|nr:unnamed protein product [Didymodactylos carnosus]CAF3644913.1 unnamed protein product [Didymodactylos carnosus]